MKLFFIGAGAIGSYLGGFLARAGHDVTIVDPWPEQIDAIKRNGISVAGPHEPFVARPKALHMHEAQGLESDFDIAFVAMKSYDTAWATRFAMRFLKPQGYVVSAQNCWNDPTIASIVGVERAVGLIMSRISVAVWAPGKVERGVEKGASTGYFVFRAGEHGGAITPRVQELSKALSVIDASQATDNLWGERWAKLCQNSMGNPVQAMSGLGTLEIASTPRGRQITVLLASETAKTGLKLGHKVPKFGGVAAEKWAQ
ncbi:MAG: NAD(P)-binding domain-containing protein, partial [Chloroflexi bacterium]|nr:NAD(P)-binding domain-containing protein [Chloroflexota bacterium]